MSPVPALSLLKNLRHSRVSGNPEMATRLEISLPLRSGIHWIPAFAGMTNGRLRSNGNVESDASRRGYLSKFQSLHIAGIEGRFRIQVRYVGSPEGEVPTDRRQVHSRDLQAIRQRGRQLKA